MTSGDRRGPWISALLVAVWSSRRETGRKANGFRDGNTLVHREGRPALAPIGYCETPSFSLRCVVLVAKLPRKVPVFATVMSLCTEKGVCSPSARRLLAAARRLLAAARRLLATAAAPRRLLGARRLLSASPPSAPASPPRSALSWPAQQSVNTSPGRLATLFGVDRQHAQAHHRQLSRQSKSVEALTGPATATEHSP